MSSDEVLSVSCQALNLDRQLTTTWDAIRDAIVRSLVVGGNSPSPPEVVGLIAGFLQRLPLPRLVHFLDMILPQMVPVKSPCRTQSWRFSSSYLVEEMTWNNPHAAELPFRVKVPREQHKYWRYVSPIRTHFDWLPRGLDTALRWRHLLGGRDLPSGGH